MEVSSGFVENHGRQDKVYQVISQFKLLLGQRANWDAACQMIRARVGPSGAPSPAAVWHLGELWSQMMHLQPAAQYDLLRFKKMRESYTRKSQFNIFWNKKMIIFLAW